MIFYIDVITNIMRPIVVIAFFVLVFSLIYYQKFLADNKSSDKRGRGGASACSRNKLAKCKQKAQKSPSKSSRPKKSSKPQNTRRNRSGSAKIKIFCEFLKSPKLQFAGYSPLILVASAAANRRLL